MLSDGGRLPLGTTWPDSEEPESRSKFAREVAENTRRRQTEPFIMNREMKDKS